MVFFEDKPHLEDCPTKRIDKEPMIKVDVPPNSKEEELKANDNVSKTDIEEQVEANIPAMKSTYSGDILKLDSGEKIATKPPRTPQYDNETTGNSRYPDLAHKLQSKS